MRILAASLGMLAAVTLSSCKEAPIELASDPIQRAAQCSAFQTLYLRQNEPEGAPVTIEQLSAIMHYSLIEAARKVPLDEKVVSDVSRIMLPVQEEISQKNWRSLGDQCIQAYPETMKSATPPVDEFKARAQCYMVTDFLAKALNDKGGGLIELSQINKKTSDRIFEYLNAAPEQDASADEYIDKVRLEGAKGFLAGGPAEFSEACRQRFG